MYIDLKDVFQFSIKKKQIIDIKILKSYKNKINSALIMAGGKGERLYPLTKKIPKPLMKIKGKISFKKY